MLCFRACGKCAEGEITDCFKLHCLTADGVEKGVMSINRKIPGPEVNVCKNDVVIVDVINRMAGTSTSLHWHGIHQRDTPFMDGVPYITQVFCISKKNKFTVLIISPISVPSISEPLFVIIFELVRQAPIFIMHMQDIIKLMDFMAHSLLESIMINTVVCTITI